jgi:hypothetical protein
MVVDFHQHHDTWTAGELPSVNRTDERHLYSMGWAVLHGQDHGGSSIRYQLQAIGGAFGGQS